MAIFKSNDGDSSAKQRSSSTPIPPGQVNIIGQGTTIEGGLTAASDVRIAGRVVGNVKVQGKTVVTPEGEIEGEIRSSQADIAGHVVGEVVIEERLVLKSTARVEGNLYTKKLVIEDGATFTGKCDMSGALPQPTKDSPRVRADARTDRPAAPEAPVAAA